MRNFSNLIIIFLVILLISLFVFSCSSREGFNAPGLTLVNPPAWFPQNSAKAYNKKDWETDVYLDMYDPNDNDKVFRFWKN